MGFGEPAAVAVNNGLVRDFKLVWMSLIVKHITGFWQIESWVTPLLWGVAFLAGNEPEKEDGNQKREVRGLF
jgi:hypothetical protein